MKTPYENLSSEDLADKVRQWRHDHPKATLTEIEDTIDQAWAQLRQKIVAELIEETAPQAETVIHYPECKATMVKNGKKKRKLVIKGGEEVSIERQQMRCLACGTTLFPPG